MEMFNLISKGDKHYVKWRGKVYDFYTFKGALRFIRFVSEK